MRVGFIGAGGIAHRHLGVLAQFADVEVAAVVDLEVLHGRARNRTGAPQRTGRFITTWAIVSGGGDQSTLVPQARELILQRESMRVER